MGHYCREGVEVIAPRNFEEMWKTTTAYKRDGCSKIKVVRYASDKNNTDTITKKFFNDYEDRDIIGSYEVKAYDIGIIGYKVLVKKNKIVNHHRQEVIEEHDYKTKPKKILKGGVLKEMHKYIIDYDGRCYDPYEHGDYDEI